MKHDPDGIRGIPVLTDRCLAPSPAAARPPWLLGALSLICLCAAFIVPFAKNGMELPSPLLFLAALVCAISQCINGHHQKRLDGRGAARAWGIWLLAIWVASFVPYRLHLQSGLNGSRERANRVRCASNLRQIGESIGLYVTDHKVWPDGLAHVLMTGELDATVFVCPSNGAEPPTGPTTQAMAAMLLDPKHCSYVYHRPAVAPPASPAVLEATVLVTERPEAHDADGMNVLYADGRVEWHRADVVQHMLRELQAGNNPPRRPVTQPVLDSNGRAIVP